MLHFWFEIKIVILCDRGIQYELLFLSVAQAEEMVS